MPRTTPTPPDFAADLAALNTHRLASDWTFQQLSDAMAVAGFRIHPRTLHYLVRHPESPTRDRTAYKIQQYVATLKPTRRPRKTTAATDAEARA